MWDFVRRYFVGVVMGEISVSIGSIRWGDTQAGSCGGIS
jgi:hypothetical protein